MPARSKLRASARYAVFVAVLISLSLPFRAAANVTTVGSVNPVPPSGGGTFSGTWTVGDEDATNTDIRAWAQINNGTSLQYSALVIGDEEGYQGEVNVLGNYLTGVNTTLTLTASALTGNATVQVGVEGTGRLNVRGATMTLTNSFADMSIGVEPSGIGYVTVSDPFTLLTVSENLIVGDEGIGSLEVLNGGWVRTTDNSSSDKIVIGSTATGIGNVTVDGLGSVLSAGSNLVVGGLGFGTLTIGDQAIVDADNQANRTVTVGTRGRVELNGGTLLGLQTFVEGYLGGSGLVRGPVEFFDTSTSGVNANQLLRFDADVTSHGAFTIDQGELQFLAGFTNDSQGLEDAPGRITLENGTVRFFEPLVNDGVISSSHGNNNLHGNITNQGYIVVSGYSVATFYDPFIDNGGMLDVLPGSTALFLSDLMFQSASALQLSVGIDEDMLDNSSQVGVAGELTLAGELMIDLSGNYVPELGQSFTLLTAAGGINGTFDNSTLPDIPGNLEFGLLYDATSVRVEVQIEQLSVGLTGDYNNNGVVDAADYTVWRDALTAGATSLVNDATPGIVDESDFLYWRAHFGETAPIGSGSGAGTVPEPTSISLFCLAAVLLLGTGRCTPLSPLRYY
jgi:T5SS/PEP-CTERM-associated repeat protein